MRIISDEFDSLWPTMEAILDHLKVPSVYPHLDRDGIYHHISDYPPTPSKAPITSLPTLVRYGFIFGPAQPPIPLYLYCTTRPTFLCLQIPCETFKQEKRVFYKWLTVRVGENVQSSNSGINIDVLHYQNAGLSFPLPYNPKAKDALPLHKLLATEGIFSPKMRRILVELFAFELPPRLAAAK